MRFFCACLCLAAVVKVVVPAPSSGFVFPDERRQKKLEPVITPPVLPVLEHLERDPSTLLPHERRGGQSKPRHFGGGFNVGPNGNGGLTASVSSSASGAGLSQAASQSFSFGFNEGFSASHSASQSSSFNGFGSGFGGSQASSQAASFAGAGSSVSGAASSASSLGGGGFGGSQSASQAFGFNTLNGFQPPDATFGEGLLDIRHRGVPNFPFPDLLGRTGRNKGIGAAAFRSGSIGPKSRDGNSSSVEYNYLVVKSFENRNDGLMISEDTQVMTGWLKQMIEHHGKFWERPMFRNGPLKAKEEEEEEENHSTLIDDSDLMPSSAMYNALIFLYTYSVLTFTS